MKTGIAFAAVLVIPLFGGICPGSESLSASREKSRLAGRMIVAELSRSVAGKAISQDAILGWINGNKAQARTSDQSLDLCRGLARKRLQEMHSEGVAGILARLESSGSIFSEEERRELSRCPAEQLDAALGKRFTDDHAAARTRACTEQQGRLTRTVRPTAEEFDGTPRDRLTTTLLDRLVRNQNEPVFEENKGFLTGVVDTVLNRAAEERSDQRRTVEQSSGGGAFAPGGIKAIIERELESCRTQRGKDAYDVFPSVRALVPRRASDIATTKFRAAISRMEFPLSEGDVRALISGNRAAHLKMDASRRLCAKEFRPGLRNKAVGEYLSRAPKGERASLRAYVEGLLEDDNTVKTTMDTLVEKSLGKAFEEARKALSEEEYRRVFSPLATSAWSPEEDYIQRLYSPKFGFRPTPPLEMEGISSAPFGNGSLYEETADRAAEAVQKLVEEGKEAITRQMGILREVDERLRGELRKPFPPLGDLVSILTEKVNGRWLPTNPPARYRPLFSDVREDIRTRAKAILDSQSSSQDMAANPSAAGPMPGTGDRPGGGTGSDKGLGFGDSTGPGAGDMPSGGDLVPDVIVDLDYTKSGIEVSLLFVRAGTSRKCILDYDSHDPDAPHPGMKKLERLFSALFDGIEVPGDQQTVDLYFVCRIFDGRVFYGVVFNLRECVKGALRSSGNARLKVHWYDALFDRRQKGKFELPPEDRREFWERSMPLSC